MLAVVVYVFGGLLWGTGLSFEDKVWNSYNYSVLQNVEPTSAQEFFSRQELLAKQLELEHIDAFIAEPSGTTQYYANFSSHQWRLSERPFLLVVTPRKTFFLTPLFELSRAKMLSIPSVTENDFVTWAEGIQFLAYASNCRRIPLCDVT